MKIPKGWKRLRPNAVIEKGDWIKLQSPNGWVYRPPQWTPAVYTIGLKVDSDEVFIRQVDKNVPANPNLTEGLWKPMKPLTRAVKTDYRHYLVALTTDPCYYGAEVTEQQSLQIADTLKYMLEQQFPGIRVDKVPTQGGIGGTNEDVIEEIHQWIEEHWTKATQDNP